MEKTKLTSFFKIRISVCKGFRSACELRGNDEVSH